MVKLIEKENVLNNPFISDDDMSFKMFADPTKWKNQINLSNATVIECIDSYVQNKSKDSKQSYKQFQSLKNHIKDIERMMNSSLHPIVICDVFWPRFHNYLFSQGLAPTTVDHLSSELHAVLEWAGKYGATISPSVADCYIGKGKAPFAKPKISLTQDEISRITYFNIDGIKGRRQQYKNTLKKVRDQFVLSCFLGQRYSDMKRVAPDDFNSGVFSITQQKTGNRAVVDIKKIAAYPHVVRQILERYDYKAPYPYSINDYNRYLHKLFEEAGFTEEIKHEYKVRGRIVTKTFKKYELISSHTARRSMITNAVQRGLHNEEVRRASGHKSEAAFSGYLCWNDN